jgi:hypothetical protein
MAAFSARSSCSCRLKSFSFFHPLSRSYAQIFVPQVLRRVRSSQLDHQEPVLPAVHPVSIILVPQSSKFEAELTRLSRLVARLGCRFRGPFGGSGGPMIEGIGRPDISATQRNQRGRVSATIQKLLRGHPSKAGKCAEGKIRID